MSRAVLIVLDSVGVGGAPDAAAFGDEGANTLGHIAEACAAGRGDQSGLRGGPLALPNLEKLGLGNILRLIHGRAFPSLAPVETPQARYGAASEVSRGKDTPSGHWEIAGLPTAIDWTYFPDEVPALPKALTDAMIREGALSGILGDCHASGTEIIERLGEEHVRSGKPIVYTSVDSVIQIAAHEESFGLERLLELCQKVRVLADPFQVNRVIARPFLGGAQKGFFRSDNRHDYSVPPPGLTVFDRLAEAGRARVSLGKIADIFAHRNTGRSLRSKNNRAGWENTLLALSELPDGGLVFTNLVDFDTEFGHRRDVPGYAAALEALDAWLPDLTAALLPDDLVIITADHGCDPTWEGANHTREQVPILCFGPQITPGSMGLRSSFADISASIFAHLDVDPLDHGTSFLG